MFRWGVLSTAKIGREHVIPAICNAHNGVLAAIASRDEGKARALADRFGAPHAFGSYEAMLASDVIDGVYIPLPTSQHVEWAIKAAEAGKHVLVEKPLALNAAQIEPLLEVEKRTGVVISEAFMVIYHPQWLKVRDLIADGALGRLRQVQGSFSYFNVDPSNMRNVPELGGGALPDIGVYPTVTTRFATGKEPLSVSATVERDPVFGTDIYADVRAKFDGFELAFYCSTQMALRQEMTFHGDKGFLTVHGPFNAGGYDHAWISLHNAGHDGAQIWRFPGVDQYRLEVETFARRARGEDVPVFTLDQSIRNQKFIDAVFRAGESGQWEGV